MQTRNRESPPNATCLALRGDKNIALPEIFEKHTEKEKSPTCGSRIDRQISRTRTQFLKYVGRKCETCGATSEIPKWTLTDNGLKCPACGHIQGGA